MDRAPPTLQCVELLLSVRLSVRLCPSVRPPRPSVCLRFLPLPRICKVPVRRNFFYTRVCCVRAERFSAEIPQQCAGLGQVHIDSTFVSERNRAVRFPFEFLVCRANRTIPGGATTRHRLQEISSQCITAVQTTLTTWLTTRQPDSRAVLRRPCGHEPPRHSPQRAERPRRRPRRRSQFDAGSLSRDWGR